MVDASRDQCNQMQYILKRYGDLTGHVVNLDKSSITFGENVGGASSYLGQPECFSWSKVDMLSFIKDKMKTKFSSWFSRTLSQGGGRSHA